MDEDPTPHDVLREAAFFDLDKTIIATSSRHGLLPPVPGPGPAHPPRRSCAPRTRSCSTWSAARTRTRRSACARSCRGWSPGWDVSLVSSIVAETLHESIDPTVYAEAVALIEEHHAAGRDVVVVSASGAEVVEPIAAILGADHVIATRMNVVDGRYTGEIDFYAYGENKASAIRDLAAGAGVRPATPATRTRTRSPTRRCSESVGHAFAVNPDRALRRLAVERGWGALSFVRPVPLFPRRARIATAGVVTAAWSRWWSPGSPSDGGGAAALTRPASRTAVPASGEPADVACGVVAEGSAPRANWGTTGVTTA